MKFIKTLAAAAVLAAVSLPSQAYVTQANNGSTELFLVIGDTPPHRVAVTNRHLTFW